MGVVNRFRKGLQKTRENMGSKLGFLFRSRKEAGGFFDALEEILISSDVGVESSLNIVAGFRDLCKEKNIFSSRSREEAFREFLNEWMNVPAPVTDERGFYVYMLLGVNGSGKTTACARLASKFKAEGRKVLLAAADTFRAAAIDQLEVWAKRVDTPLIRQQQGADPGAVVFDALTAARSRGMDTLIADTAGRFHNRENLVRELQKIDKIIARKTGPGDRYLKLAVLDATAGSNAFEQARSFHAAVRLDGIILSKMDSSARGGVALSITGTLKLPILMLGMGEGVNDLLPFDRQSFIGSLLVESAD